MIFRILSVDRIFSFFFRTPGPGKNCIPYYYFDKTSNARGPSCKTQTTYRRQAIFDIEII